MQDPTAGQAGSAARSALLAPPPPAGDYRVRTAPTSLPESGHGPPVASFCSGGCPADSSVVDFELFTDPSVYHQLTTQYDSLGVVFDSTVVAVAPGYYYQNYPPRSGAAVATADFTLPGGGSGFLYFSFPAAEAVRVRVYVTSLSPITLRCFAAGGAELGATVFAGGNTVETQGGVPNQPVEVSAPGIRSCRLEGADNQYSVDDLTVVWEEAAQVVLTCTPSVVRGAEGTCTAFANLGTATLEILGWSFRPAEIDTVLVRTDGVVTDSTWGGPIVAPGEVRVRALVNGVSDSASATIAVTARDWSAQPLKFVVEEFTPANLPLRPRRVGELANFAPFAEAFFPPTGTVTINIGPNGGFIYFTEVPVEGLARIQINRVALSGNSQFYMHQRPDQAPPLAGVCRRADVMPFLPLAEAHEGLGLESLSHAGVFQAELNRLVPQTTESIIGFGATLELLDLIQAGAQGGIDLAKDLARDQLNGGLVPPVTYHCEFKYFN